MRVLITAIRQIVGLFIDDGSLAAVTLVWIALCGVTLSKLVPAALQGPTLFVGLALILLESAIRGAKHRARSTFAPALDGSRPPAETDIAR